MTGRAGAGRLNVEAVDDQIHVGEHFALSLQRTLRIPDDGREYPLPPGLGRVPISLAEPGDAGGSERLDGAFIAPMYQREAVWLSFSAPARHPVAVMVAVGAVNAVSGEPWDTELSDDPQNYVVCPDQPWLDGVNTGRGTVRQFVAVSLGAGDTVEEQLTGTAQVGGIQLRVFESKPGMFAPRPAGEVYGLEAVLPQNLEAEGAAMGVAPGGIMRQRIYPDPYGPDTWDRARFGEIHLYLLNSLQYEALVGAAPPPSPVSAQTYSEHGLPWFSLYDEQRGDIAPSERLRGVRSLRERDAQRGDAPDEADRSFDVDPGTVVELRNPPTAGDDGAQPERST